MKPFVIRWDWKSKPDWETINAKTSDWKEPAIFYEIDTDSDDYAVIVSPTELEESERRYIWLKFIGE